MTAALLLAWLVAPTLAAPVPVKSMEGVTKQLIELDGEVRRRSLNEGGTVSQNLRISSSVRVGGNAVFDSSLTANGRASFAGGIFGVSSGAVNITGTTTNTTFGVCQGTVTLPTPHNMPLVAGFIGTLAGSNVGNDIGWTYLVNGAFANATSSTKGLIMQSNISAATMNLSGEDLLAPQGTGTVNLCITFACGSGACTTTFNPSGTNFGSAGAKFFVHETGAN